MIIKHGRYIFREIHEVCKDLWTALNSAWAKIPWPSNVSGIDGCAPTISKHVPQRNLSLCGTNTPLCPWWDWLFVLMDGYHTQSQFHLHPLRALSPFPPSTLHLSCLSQFVTSFYCTSYCSCFLFSYYYILIIFFIFIYFFSHVLLARCIHASPRFPFTTSPLCLSPISTYH